MNDERKKAMRVVYHRVKSRVESEVDQESQIGSKVMSLVDRDCRTSISPHFTPAPLTL